MENFVQTNKYTTIGDDGRYYEVIEYAEFNPDKGFGTRQYELNDGLVVNRLSETEFQILTTDLKLKLIN